MSDHAHDHAHGGHDHDAHSPQHYVKIWAVLCVLLFVSIAGPMLEIPIVTLFTAFGVAGIKAYIVMKYFMHLDVERPVVHYILATAVAFMVMMFAAVGVDVHNHDGARWSNDGAKAAIERGMAYGDPADHHAAGHGGGEHAAKGEEKAPAAH